MREYNDQNKYDSQRDLLSQSQHRNKVYVRIPENNFTRKIIDKLSKYVVQVSFITVLTSKDGSAIEQVVIEREKDNPEFSFLTLVISFVINNFSVTPMSIITIDGEYIHSTMEIQIKIGKWTHFKYIMVDQLGILLQIYLFKLSSCI